MTEPWRLSSNPHKPSRPAWASMSAILVNGRACQGNPIELCGWDNSRISPAARSEVRANPYIVQLVPPQGGHVGFLAASGNGDPDDRWAEHRLLQFFRLLK